MELRSGGVTYENMEHSKATKESVTGQYQDLDQGTNPGQYQELVKKTETSVKLVTNKPEVTYENTKMHDQSKSEPKNQSEQSQYEELNTGNERKDEHNYCEVSLR